MQGLLFYIPYFLWESYEGQKLRKLVQGLQEESPLLKLSPQIRDNIQLLADFITTSWSNKPLYCRFYFLCVVLSFLHVCFQLWFINYFLNGIFMNYGFDGIYKVLTAEGYDDEFQGWQSIFPRMTKCNFFKYGPSGTLQTKDALCVLALNNISEKVFLILWLWLLILALVTTIYLSWLIILMAVPQFRLCYFFMPKNNLGLKRIMAKADFEDWFLLHLLYKNLDEILLNELVYCLELNLISSRCITPTIQHE